MGLEIVSSTLPECFARACTSFVLPAPSVPTRATTLPSGKFSASKRPRRSVSDKSAISKTTSSIIEAEKDTHQLYHSALKKQCFLTRALALQSRVFCPLSRWESLPRPLSLWAESDCKFFLVDFLIFLRTSWLLNRINLLAVPPISSWRLTL